MKLLNDLRTKSAIVELLAKKTLDVGMTDAELIRAVAQTMFEETQDNDLRPFMHKRLTIKNLWELKKTTYTDGPYKGKRVFSSRDSSKHIVDVLKARGYDFKYPNNLDFIHNMLYKGNFTKYSDFKAAIQSRSSEYFCSYALRQIDAMVEYGHLN